MRRLTGLVGLALAVLVTGASAQTSEIGARDAGSARSQPGSLIQAPPPLVEAGENLGSIDAILANLSRRSWVQSVAWSPDGRSLASGTSDKTIRLWDVASARETARLEGHTSSVGSIAWSPDGRSLASGSSDKTIRLWDVASAKETARLEGHTDSVESVAWSPDGRSLASGSEENTIRFWDVSSAKETAIAAGGQRGTWLFCQREGGLCRRYDDGTLARSRAADGRFAAILPNAPLDGVGLVEEVVGPLRSVEGTALPIRSR